MTLGSVNVGGGHGFENGEKEQMQSWLKWMLMCREKTYTWPSTSNQLWIRNISFK